MPATALQSCEPQETLFGVEQVRLRCNGLMALAQAGRARHFTWHPERMALVSAYVISVIRQRYPDGVVPPHSCWRFIEIGGVDRWAASTRVLGLDTPSARLERARAGVDLAVLSVLLGEGVGAGWRYVDAATDQTLTRSEGLGVACLRWWACGGLSSDALQPARVDATGLTQVQPIDLARAFQVGQVNALVGLNQRVGRLRRLAQALRAHPAVFGQPQTPGVLRPGHLVDTLWRQAPDGRIRAAHVLSIVLGTLGRCWMPAEASRGASSGDCWPHPDAPGGWVPFHEKAQWLTYSLCEPLADAGLTVVGMDELTGLPGCRHGGLLLDLGLLQARERTFHTTCWSIGDQPIVEWRALTVASLDHLAESVRGELGLTPQQCPLSAVLEGGSWAAGRQIAQAKRPGGPPPLRVDEAGASF